MDITIGQKIKLINHFGIEEVAGYEENKEYTVSNIRIKDNNPEIFLAGGNIHPYHIENFYNIKREDAIKPKEGTLSKRVATHYLDLDDAICGTNDEDKIVDFIVREEKGYCIIFREK